MRLNMCVLLLVASAVGAEPTVPEVMKELRRIESAQYRNQADLLRIEYQNESAKAPNEVMPKVYAAWTSMVSDGAWNQLKSIAQIRPDNPWVHYGMARVYTVWKMRDQARAELDAALKKDPKFSPAIAAQAEVLGLQKEWATAELKYREALDLNDDPRARAGLGLVLLEQGKTAAGKKELLAAIAGWPDQPAALSALMPLLIADKDPSCVEVASHLADLKPKDREIRRRLAELRFDAGDTQGAMAEYEKLLKLGDPDPMVVRKLIAEYQKTGDAEHEQAMQTMLVTLDRDDASPALRLGELKLAANDLEGAQAQYLVALERDPKRAATLVELAKLKLKLGGQYEAIERYREASKLDGPAADLAKTELAKLENEIRLPKRPARGTVDAIYNSVATSLDSLYGERKKANPKLAGDLKLRVRVAATGAVQGVDLIGDTVGDPVLAAHAYFALRDADFEKKKREPVFEFELGKKKK